MSSLIVRPLQSGDIAALQAIDTKAHGSSWSHRTFLDEVERPDRMHLVAEDDGQVLGHASAWIDNDACRITNVAVDDVHVGRGYATTLLLAVVDHALGNRRVANMQLEVRPSNRRAQRMYNRFGFVPVGIERDFYDRADTQGSRDAVVMVVADVCADSWRNRLAELKADHDEYQKNAGAAA